MLKPYLLVLTLFGLLLFSPRAMAQEVSLNERLATKITLDARNMSIVDVIHYIAKQGSFNTVISPAVTGNSSLLLQAVEIKSALNLIAKVNHLAYTIDKDIISVTTATEYEAAYGKKFNDATEISIVHLQYTKPAYALAVLDNIKSNNGKITIDEDTGSVMLEDTPASIAVMKKAITQIDRPLDTIAYTLRYAKAAELITALQARIDTKGVGTTSFDDRSNQIFVRVFPGRHAEIQRIIQSLDLPAKQVMIETRILQVNLKPKLDSEINWTALIKNNGKNKFNIKTSTNNTNTNNFFGQVGVGEINVDEFGAQLQVLEQVSDSKILASPKILATNNEEAKIHVGDSVPYVSTTTTGSGDNAFRIENPRFIDEGIIITVTPTINDDGLVTMRIQPKITTITGRLESIQGGIPQVNTTEINTTIMVQDGMTVVMAGLRQQQKIRSKAGVPGLMNTPYIGSLFSKTADDATLTELVILMTPHIVKGKTNGDVQGHIKSSKQY